MKINKSLLYLLLMVQIQNFAQSINITPNQELILKGIPDGLKIESGNSAFKFVSNASSGAVSGGFETKTNHVLYLGADFVNDIVIDTLGNVGIGPLTTPTAKLHIYRGSKLGLDAPAILTKLFIGTTAAVQGASSVFEHGLDASKILSITLLIDTDLGYNVPENYKIYAGFQAGVSFENTYIYIWNSPANSSQILNKPVQAFVTYEY
jgi:hypothetical protein